jgi:hypothetical protein
MNENNEGDSNTIVQECLNDIIDKISINEEKKANFYETLIDLQKMQQNILKKTAMSKEKIKNVNEIGVSQLKEFKENSQKYGRYLKGIHTELNLITDMLK